MSRRGVYLAFLFTVACVTGQESSCWILDEPTPLPTPTPAVSPSPTPTPSPTPVPISCVPDWLKVDGPAVLPVREKGTYWLTPMQNYVEDGMPKSRQVPDACNVPKASSVRWSFPYQGDVLYAAMTPDGFSVVVSRIAVAQITLRVEFEGLFAQKVIQ